jgi:hypothetical protein
MNKRTIYSKITHEDQLPYSTKRLTTENFVEIITREMSDKKVTSFFEHQHCYKAGIRPIVLNFAKIIEELCPSRQRSITIVPVEPINKIYQAKKIQKVQKVSKTKLQKAYSTKSFVEISTNEKVSSFLEPQHYYKAELKPIVLSFAKIIEELSSSIQSPVEPINKNNDYKTKRAQEVPRKAPRKKTKKQKTNKKQKPNKE